VRCWNKLDRGGLLLILALAGCGDDEESTGSDDSSGTETSDGGSSASGTGDGGSSASGTGDGGSSAGDTGDDGSSGTETGNGGSSASDTSDGGSSDPGSSGDETGGTGGSTDLRFQILNLEISQDCMPMVPPDPAMASWDLEVYNAGVIGGDADVVSATFLDDADAPLATFEVSPTNTGIVDEAQTVVVPMEKVLNSLDPANGCAVLPCQETAKVELVMDADDTGMVTVVGSATVECSY
jgi:hypothetical protein